MCGERKARECCPKLLCNLIKITFNNNNETQKEKKTIYLK